VKRAIMSECKSNEHSEKDCVCGGHNARNAKKNRNHNGTKKKLERRRGRKPRP
jgi:hypothetical protein